MSTTLAWSTTTGDAPIAPEAAEHEPHCYLCNRHTDHFAEHDDQVEAGLAAYTDGGDVIWTDLGRADRYREAARQARADGDDRAADDLEATAVIAQYGTEER